MIKANDLRLINPSISSLTGLRFIAAFLVCLGHSVPKLIPVSNTASWYPPTLQFATQGMTLFFILSGFVIHYNYSELIKKNYLLGIYNFLIARFSRLYPLYFVCLGYDLVKNFGYSTLVTHFRDAILYYLTLTQSWFYIPLGSNALIFQFGLMPQVSWSISTEWFFYLIYPLICFSLLYTSKLYSKIIALFFIFSIWIIYIGLCFFTKVPINDSAVQTYGMVADMTTNFQDSFFNWLMYFSPYSRINEFLIGCIIAAIFMQTSSHKLSHRQELFGFAITTASIISIGFFMFFPFKAYNIWGLQTLNQYYGFSLATSVIIYSCARYNNIITRLISNPFMLLGGEISYSIYLLHLPVIEAFSRDAAIVTSLKVGLADGARLMFTLATIFGLSMVSYRIIESPSRRLFRKWMIIRSIKPIGELENLKTS